VHRTYFRLCSVLCTSGIICKMDGPQLDVFNLSSTKVWITSYPNMYVIKERLSDTSRTEYFCVLFCICFRRFPPEAPSKLAQAIQGMPDSNLDLDTGYRDSDLTWFSSVSPVKCRNRNLNRPRHLLSVSFQIQYTQSSSYSTLCILNY
jgi:hypothetical protein